MEGHIAVDDFGLLPIDSGREALVKRNRKDEHACFLCIDMSDKAVCGRVKAVAGIPLQPGDALLPIRNVVNVERLHAALIGGQIVVAQRHGGEHHNRHGGTVHPLVMGAVQTVCKKPIGRALGLR